MTKKIVIAGNYKQFTDYMRKSKSDPATTHYVNCEEHLLGIRDVEVIYVGEHWLNPVCNHPLIEYIKTL